MCSKCEVRGSSRRMIGLNHLHFATCASCCKILRFSHLFFEPHFKNTGRHSKFKLVSMTVRDVIIAVKKTFSTRPPSTDWGFSEFNKRCEKLPPQPYKVLRSTDLVYVCTGEHLSLSLYIYIYMYDDHICS